MKQGPENLVNPCEKEPLCCVVGLRRCHFADAIMMAGEGAGPPLGLEPFIHQVCQVQPFGILSLASVGGRS